MFDPLAPSLCARHADAAAAHGRHIGGSHLTVSDLLPFLPGWTHAQCFTARAAVCFLDTTRPQAGEVSHAYACSHIDTYGYSNKCRKRSHLPKLIAFCRQMDELP